MQAGQIRHRVTIQERTTTTDQAGQPLETWTEVLAAWAAIEPVGGREYLESRSIQTDVSHQVRMRYQAGVTADMRVLYGARTLRIVAVINRDERNREMLLMCEE
jgi:SPP1 family predicted phage head-tail adaptor